MLQASYQRGGRTITIQGHTISMPCKVACVITLPDRVLVLLNTYELADSDPLVSRNIFALDQEGKELWRIEPSEELFTGKDGKDYPAPWMDLRWAPDGRSLWVHTFYDHTYVLNPQTGAHNYYRAT